MAAEINRDPDLEWLDLVNPVGLVVASPVIKDMGLTPIRQTSIDSQLVEDLVSQDENQSALTDVWQFMEQVLGWNAEYIAGAPNGPPIPDEFKISLPEHGTVLSPDWAVKMGTEENPWQLLIKLYDHGVKPDDRAQSDGWEATPHQRFERLLRDSGVFAGLMILSNEFRLVYAPKGETSGYISFPIRPLATVAGRPMLAGLKLLLDETRLFLEPEDRRLPAILKASREAQVEVSTKLADQVLGALHELLRGFYAASPEKTVELAEADSERLYDGLLTILMRLVFILYAEDRDLLPSRSDKRAREIYELSYSLRGLYARLVEDESKNPDTMDERHGAWGQLLVLFRMIHGGYPIESEKSQQFVISRGGKLFNPDEFPFIEGREDKSDEPKILNITDGCILRILTDLMTLQRRGQDRERLSYRTLDVEQIGSVYETIMGFTIKLADDQMVAIRAGKNNKTPVFVGLNKLLEETTSKARTKYIRDHSDKDLTPQMSDQIERASTLPELKTILDNIIDERGSPNYSIVNEGTPVLQPTDERRSSGSHYTPRVLTESVVKHTLEPIFEQLGENPRPSEILELKICDPAMGSGAFLVEVCRALGRKLVQSWKNHGKDDIEVNSEEDEEIFARRLVVSRCIYGVDRNPRAVDLAKLSLWLTTLAKNEEFTFIDHALKCGDSLVGLTKMQLGNATWETGELSEILFSKEISSRINKILTIRENIREANQNTPVSQLESQNIDINLELSQVRDFGDSIIAAFFNFMKESDRKDQRALVQTWFLNADLELTKIQNYANEFRQGELSFQPFHWEIEYPEVFNENNWGFDAIVGNPPFAGKNTISAGNRPNYIKWLLHLHKDAHGKSDLVAHFFRKSFGLLNNNGVLGLIATNSVSEGVTKSSGLDKILSEGGKIYRARTQLKWTGEANVFVSIIHIKKGEIKSPILNNNPVKHISANLVEEEFGSTPKTLQHQQKLAFQGITILGKGFEFDDKAAIKGECENLNTMKDLIEKDSKNRAIIHPYLGGDEVNSSPTHDFHRYIINFGDRPLCKSEKLNSWISMSPQLQKSTKSTGIVPNDYPYEVAEDWPDLIDIIRKRVKPIRDEQEREALKRRWWQYAEKRPGLINATKDLKYVCVTSRRTKHWAIARIENKLVCADSLVVFAFQNFSPFAVLQSRVHELWAKYYSTKGATGLTYTPSNCFSTFPFPDSYEISENLEIVGRKYHDFRANLMIELNEGMTQIYNRFHDRNERDMRIEKLRELHTLMDHEVLKAYGRADLVGSANPEFINIKSEDEKHSSEWFDWNPDFKDSVFGLLLEKNIEYS